jgi:hypothetical protein
MDVPLPTVEKQSLLRRLPWGAIATVLLTLPALWVLARPGFFVSHDGRFHVYRIAALAAAWNDGVLVPRLFPDFGFGYGQAVLNFYAPLSYFPGALLAFLGLSPAAAAKITLAGSFVLAALAAYGYGRALAGTARPGLAPAAGVLAAVVYTYTPYHLADAYIRGALPEHVAFIFPPLILWSYHAAFKNTRNNAWPPLLWSALAWVALVLTHNLTALITAPAALVYLLVLAGWTGRWRRLAGAVGAMALAVGITAAYWLPVLLESRFVGLALGPSRGYAEHWLTAATLVRRSLVYFVDPPDTLGRIYALSWFALALAGLVGVLLLIRWRQRRLPAAWPPMAFHLALAAGAMLMTTAASAPVWDLFKPVLGNLQYPWRFLVLEALGLLGLAAALPALLPRVHPALVAAIIAPIALFVGLPGLAPEPLALPASYSQLVERMWQEDAEAGQVGATWTAEFLPLTVTEQRWALGRPREGAADGPAIQPAPTVTLTAVQHAGLTAQIDTQAPFQLRLHQFHLPGWNAAVDGQPVPTYPSGELGLVTVDVPADTHVVTLRFGATAARTAGAVVSLLALAAWLILVWWRGRTSRSLLAASLAVAAIALALALNGLGIGQRTWTPQSVQATLEDVAVLLAAEAEPLPEEDAVAVTLTWLALREVSQNYKAFVHVLGPDGSVIAQHDGDPVGGFTPATRWRPGEIIRDQHVVPLPAGLPPGDYALRAGLYQFDPPRNLSVEPPAPDNRVDIGVVKVP